jgi:hypothetical protein
MMCHSLRLLERMRDDNDRFHLYVRVLLRSLLLTQHRIALRFLRPAPPLDFRQRETERHSGAELFNCVPIRNSMAKADIGAQIILHLPDYTD